MAGPNFSYDGWHLTFSENFDTLNLWNGTDGRWKTQYYNGDRTIFGNGELEVYTDPAYRGSADHPLGLDPFSISDGILRITAQPTPAEGTRSPISPPVTGSSSTAMASPTSPQSRPRCTPAAPTPCSISAAARR